MPERSDDIRPYAAILDNLLRALSRPNQSYLETLGSALYTISNTVDKHCDSSTQLESADPATPRRRRFSVVCPRLHRGSLDPAFTLKAESVDTKVILGISTGREHGLELSSPLGVRVITTWLRPISHLT